MYREIYYDIKNVCEGLTKHARDFLDFNIDTSKEIFIDSRFGKKKDFTLKKYFLMDGSVAEEYIQMIMTNDRDQKIYFLGLKIGNQMIKWSSKEMLSKVKTKTLN